MWGLLKENCGQETERTQGEDGACSLRPRRSPAHTLIWAPCSGTVTWEFLLFQPLGLWYLEQQPDKLNNKSLQHPRGLVGGISTQGRTVLWG